MPTPGPCSALRASARPAPPRSRAERAKGGDCSPSRESADAVRHHLDPTEDDVVIFGGGADDAFTLLDITGESVADRDPYEQLTDFEASIGTAPAGRA